MQSTYPLIPVILYASMWWLDDQWMEIHVKEGNASGTNHTSANISKFFWVMQVREEIQKVGKYATNVKLRNVKPQIK